MKMIPLTRGQFAFVDDASFELVSQWKWRASKNENSRHYYADRTQLSNGKRCTIRMHRLLVGIKDDDKRYVDHINGNSLDNRVENLRIATCSQNLMNRGANANNKSGFKGVAFEPKRRRWRATITVDGKHHSLGLHKSPEDAHAAYCIAARRLHGEFANFGVVPPKQGAPPCQQQQ